MDLQSSYHDKFITMDEALSQIKSGDVIAVAAYGNEPVRFLRRLHEIRDRGVRDVTLWLANPQEEYPFLKMEGMEDVISILSIFYGKSLRDIHSTGRVSFVPNNLHGCVDAMLRTRKPNVFVGAVTPVDRFGYVCMSTSQQFELELFDTCQTVMLEINPALPHIAGTTRIPVDKVHYFMEGENTVVNSPVYPKTEIQETIRKKCPEDYFTIIMRRLMMKISERIARDKKCQALITGESLGQVASQTIGAIACTDAAANMPVFRPLIGMDKQEIIDISYKIDTFETSIEPYEDCCTVFTPKHPRTKPVLERIEDAEAKGEFDEMIERALQNLKLTFINRED